MGVDFSIALVDWSEFEQAVRGGADLEVLSLDFPDEELSSDGWALPAVFMECFGAMKARWNSPARDAFAEIFGTLFWSHCGGERAIDLDVPADQLPFGLESAWSPTRVKRLAELWPKVSLDSYRESFVPSPDENDPFANFDEFKAYAEEWAAIIQRGAAEGLGLIVLVYG